MGGADYWETFGYLTGRIPTQILVIYPFLLLTDISILYEPVNQTPVRVLTGFLILLFVPGYTLTLLVFPEQRSSVDPRSSRETVEPRGIDGAERIVLSVALSVVIAMFVALFVHLVGLGVRVEPVLLTLNAVVFTASLVAAYRLANVPIDQRFQPAPWEWVRDVRTEFASFRGLDRYLLIVGLVLLALVGMGTAYTAVTPGPDDRYTEMYLLHQNETGGLAATDYPTELTAGTTTPFTVGVRNHEFEPVSYTVVVELQRTERRDATAPIREERELGRFRLSTAHGDTVEYEYNVSSTMTGEDLRLVYLLYRGDPPSDPSRQNAYRSLHLWVDITEPDSTVEAAGEPSE